MPARAEPGERVQPVGKRHEGQDERDDRGQEQAEDGIGDEESGEPEGEAEAPASVEDRRCRSNETGHAATVAPRHRRAPH